MRTHTIPQNVTSYEDKLVGMFIGRQFIYLAIGGVTAFILLTADLGPLFIRMLLAMAVGGLAVALALLKINDRGFDVLFFSYMKAVLGPTEWVWQQEQLPMRVLIQPDAPVAAKPTAVAPDSQVVAEDNRRRVSQFEDFLNHQRSDLDNDERNFIARLNYSEDIPQSAFRGSTSAAPPMLTPDHPKPAPLQVSEPVKPYTPIAPKPLSPLASPSGSLHVFVPMGTQERAVPLKSNQRTNRSLSRQLLSGGTLPLPVRGELSLAMPPELKHELGDLIGFAPAGVAVPSLPAASSYQVDLALVTAAKAQDTGVVAQAAAPPMSTPEPPSPPPVSTSSPAEPPAAPADPDPVGPPPEAPSVPAAEPEPTTIEPPQPANEADLQVAAEQVESQMANLSQHDPLLQSAAPAEPDIPAAPTNPAAIPFKAHEVDLPQDPSKQVRPILNTVFDQPQAPATPNGEVAPLPTSALNAPASAEAVVVPAQPPSDKFVPLTNHPNVVNGVVLDASGQFLSGVVVVVKDGSGEPKRALKTNKLGQFVILTPLPDGTYTVEVDKKGLTFDIMQVTLSGAVPPPIEIKAKAS